MDQPIGRCTNTIVEKGRSTKSAKVLFDQVEKILSVDRLLHVRLHVVLVQTRIWSIGAKDDGRATERGFGESLDDFRAR